MRSDATIQTVLADSIDACYTEATIVIVVVIVDVEGSVTIYT